MSLRALSFIFLAILLFSGGYCASAFAQHYPVTITDAMGRTVTIDRPVKRIALSGSCLDEAFMIIGVWDKVVGRGYDMYPDKKLYPGIENIPIFATDTPGPYNVNYEKLLALDVDLLFTIKIDPTGFEEMNNRIKSRIKVVALDMFLPETVKSNFELLAEVLDAEPEVKEYLDWYDNIVRSITARTSGLPQEKRKRFFLNWSFGQKGSFPTLSDKFPGMSATNHILGGINVAADLKGKGMNGAVVDPEWLMQQQIDIIICQGRLPGAYGAAVEDSTKIASHREAIMALPVFASSEAVRKDNVYMMYPRLMFSPGLPLYLAYLAKWFHPALFPDLDPQSLHQEYLTRFLHSDLNLSRQGVFVYPQ
jgi:iron complex transport system substrate-binding protein